MQAPTPQSNLGLDLDRIAKLDLNGEAARKFTNRA